jgi:hypothetical protein
MPEGVQSFVDAERVAVVFAGSQTEFNHRLM